MAVPIQIMMLVAYGAQLRQIRMGYTPAEVENGDTARWKTRVGIVPLQVGVTIVGRIIN